MHTSLLTPKAPQSKRLADPDGRIVARVKRREDMPMFIFAPAAMQLLRAVSSINEKRARSDYALTEIRKHKAAIEEAERTLLAERATIEDSLRKLLLAAADFVRAVKVAA